MKKAFCSKLEVVNHARYILSEQVLRSSVESLFTAVTAMREGDVDTNSPSSNTMRRTTAENVRYFDATSAKTIKQRWRDSSGARFLFAAVASDTVTPAT